MLIQRCSYHHLIRCLAHAASALDTVAVQLAPPGSIVTVIHVNRKTERCEVLNQEHTSVLVHSRLYGGQLSVQLFRRSRLPVQPYIDLRRKPELVAQ